jgi:hypothetical protein
MLIDAFKVPLCSLFGAGQWRRVRRDVTAGRDSHFDLSPELAAAWEKEQQLEESKEPPLPRTGAGVHDA